MKKWFLIFVILMSFVCSLNAQDYKTGIGLRAGLPSGLTLKHFVNRNAAFEGLLTTRWQGFDITGLYEIQNRAFDVAQLSWYYGGGAHIGFYNGRYTYWGTYGTAYTVFGIDGIIGLEYTFSELPVNVGIDFKPVFNLIGYTGVWSDGALSVRFVF